MKDVFQWVRQRLTLQAEKRKEYYDSSRGVKPHDFRAGDLVLIRRQAPFPRGETPKLGFRFLGPFRVCKTHPPSTLVIEDPRRPGLSRTVHSDKAIHFKSLSSFPDPPSSDSELEQPMRREEIAGERLYDATGVMDLSQYSPTAFPDALPDIPLNPQLFMPELGNHWSGEFSSQSSPLASSLSLGSLEDLSSLGASPPVPGTSSSSHIPRASHWRRALYPPALQRWRRQLFATPTALSQTSTPSASSSMPVPDGTGHGYHTRAKGPVPDYPLPERWRQPKRRQAVPPTTADESAASFPRTENPLSSSPSTEVPMRDRIDKSPPPISYIVRFPWEEECNEDEFFEHGSDNGHTESLV